VTGNGTVSALDAAVILQRVAGLRGQFPIALACESDWAFARELGSTAAGVAIPPAAGAGNCLRGGVAGGAALVSEPDGLDLLGILFGDCTGNWQPAAGTAAAAPAALPHPTPTPPA
jgi:hypothetical protein